jgi:hypothetical protein
VSRSWFHFAKYPITFSPLSSNESAPAYTLSFYFQCISGRLPTWQRLLHLQGLRIPSISEAAFRLRQEAANFRLLVRPSAPSGLRWRPLPFPETSVLRRLATEKAASAIIPLAHRIAAGELPVFDTWIRPANGIRWRCDWANGKETGTAYFRRIPYLDFERSGDHKRIWEINRHQHLVTLAQAWVLDGDSRWLEALEQQLRSWWEQNPPQRGINWASALEVAFRSLSWMWILHWTHDALPQPLRQELLASLHLHGQHLASNLSVYFSPNTHLQGEAVALHTIGMALGEPEWERTGQRILDQERQRQVLADGAHFELSSYYHVYALDFFLLHAILRGHRDGLWRETLSAMAAILQALLGADGVLPLLGDDDGGRLFHPHGFRRGFGCATLSACLSWLGKPAAAGLPVHWEQIGLWWLGDAAPPASPAPAGLRHACFPDSGLRIWTWPEGALYFDTGGFGALSAGHSHADGLSLSLRWRAADILTDLGTFTYMTVDRDRFRTTPAHNTITAGPGQAIPAGPFSWHSRPAITAPPPISSRRAAAVCRYGGLAHHRQILIDDGPLVWVLDTVEGPVDTGAAQHWHTPEQPRELEPSVFELSDGVRLALTGGSTHWEPAARSQVYGSSLPCWRIRQQTACLPRHTAASGRWYAAAAIDLAGNASGALRLNERAGAVELEWAGQRRAFPATVTTQTT